MKCPKCGKEYGDSLKFCTACGEPKPNEDISLAPAIDKSKKIGWKTTSLIGLCLLVVIGLILGLTIGLSTSPRDTANKLVVVIKNKDVNGLYNLLDSESKSKGTKEDVIGVLRDSDFWSLKVADWKIVKVKEYGGKATVKFQVSPYKNETTALTFVKEGGGWKWDLGAGVGD